MIEIKNVSKYYNNNGVVTLGLRNINLNFDKNEIVAIVGESGSGKSTLLNVICGVDSYEEGEIVFEGYETSYFNREDMDTFRKKNVSFIYQNYNIIDSYTVLENVMFPLLINGYDKKEAKKRALELIEKVGLSHRVHNRGVKLSGGEKQRCIIARALATDAPILACDEPTGNLDSKTGEEIIKLIKEVSKDKLVLIVTHNYEQVENIVTRTIRMADGEVVSDSNVNNNVTTELKDGDIFTEDNKKIKYKTIAQIGLNNLKSTPKKNIFVFLVLLVLSLIGLVLFGEAYIASVNSNYNAHTGFANTIRERVIVFDKTSNIINYLIMIANSLLLSKSWNKIKFRKIELLLLIIINIIIAMMIGEKALFLTYNFLSSPIKVMIVFLLLMIYILPFIYNTLFILDKINIKEVDSYDRRRKNSKKFSLLIFLIFFIIWLLAGIGYYPGNMTSDSVGQMHQSLGLLPIDNAHPALCTIIMRWLLQIWNNPFIIVIADITLMSFILSHIYKFVLR